MIRKRLMAFGIIFSIFLGCIQVCAADEKGYSAEEVDALSALNIMVGYSGNKFSQNGKLTRNEFVNMVCNLTTDKAFEGSKLTDEAADTAEALGIDTSGRNDEKSGITYGDALKMTLDALGYKYYASVRGGYEKAAKAADINLADYKAGAALTKGKAARLLYEAINAKIVRVNKIDGDNVWFDIVDDATVLSEMRKIDKVEGLADANNITALTDGDKKADDAFSIDGKTYKTDSDRYNSLLGMNVTAWVKDDSLVYAMRDRTRTQTLTIDLKEVDGIDADCRKLTYYKDDARKATVNISKIVRVIYNGKAYEEYTSDDFLSKQGKITLIDNNSDKVYDVVKIDSYKTMVTDTVYAEGQIFGKYTYKGALTDIDLEDNDYTILKNNKKVKFGELKEWDVLDVYESKGDKNKYIFIEVSRNTAEGTLDVSEDDKVKIDGKEYELTNALQRAIEENDLKAPAVKVGSKYKIYIDCSGRIAAWSIINSDTKYALVIALSESKIFDDSDLKIKMLTDDNRIGEYYFSDRTKFNGSKTSNSDIYKSLAPDGKAVQQLIEYTLNDEGEISSVKTAQETEESNPKVFTKTARKKGTYYINDNSLSQSKFVGSKALIFFVSKLTYKGEEQEPTYSVMTRGALYDWTTYNYVAYNIDDFGESNLFVMYEEGEPSFSDYNPLFLVREKGSILSGGEAVDVMYGTLMSDADRAVIDKTGKLFADVKRGDILKIGFDRGGIPSFEKIYNFTDDGSEDLENVWPGNTNITIKGYVQKVDIAGRRFIVGDKKQTVRWFWDIPINIYDVKRDKVEKGSLNDIKKGDYAVMRMIQCQLREIVLIRR